MKQKNLLTTMLLLFALIVGSMNAWAEEKTDVLNQSWTGVTGTSYTSKSELAGSASDAVYSVQCAGSNSSIQLRSNNNNSGIVSTTSGGTVKKVVVTWNTSTSDSRTLNIYGSNTAYSAPTDLYNSSKQGTLLGTIVCGTSTELEITDEFAYIGIRSASGALYLTEVDITWEAGGDTPATYTVTYDGNGNTSGDVPTDDTEYSKDDEVTVLGNTGDLAKEHYTFDGWNTKADGTGTDYVAGNAFTISANTTLYAQWAANTNTVTLPTADEFGTYTMSAENPVAYGTEVTLTYEPATGYEQYVATWSVNGVEISGNKFTMPDEAVTVTVNVAKSMTKNMTIDFEQAIGYYTDWETSNIGVSNSEITAHGGSYHGFTGGATAYIQTVDKVTPVSLTCYVSKKSNNTTSSTWYIQVSEDGSDWTLVESTVESTSASDMNKGVWKEFSADLSSYSDVYVRVYYNGTTAVRAIDDLTLVVQDSGEPSIDADAVVNLTAEDTEGEIAYTINNPVDGTILIAATTADWISDVTVESDKVTFTTSANTGEARTATITLTYGSLTKDVTVNQAKHIVTNTYTLATSITPGKKYVIASGTDGDVSVMGAQNNNNRGVAEGTVSNSTLSVSSEAGAAEFVIYGPDASGMYTIYDPTENGYLYAAASGSNHLKTQSTNNVNGKWKIAFNEDVASIVASNSSNRNVMQYNGGSSIFSCYASASQSPVYLYESTDNSVVPTTTTVKLNANGYATFATTDVLDFLDAEDADFSAWQITSIDNNKIIFEQINTTVAAGKGILLKGEANADVTLNILPAGGDVLKNNLLEGITSATEVTANQYFGLSGNKFVPVNAGTIPAGKALLPANEVSGARQLTFVFEGETTGIADMQTVKNVENGKFYNLNGQQVAQPKKGLYIVNGKKYSVK